MGNKYNETERISTLLAKRFFNNANEKDNDEIELWVQESEQRRKMVQQLQDPSFVAGEYERTKAVHVEGALNEMKYRINNDRLFMRLRKPLLQAAAIALLLFSATAIYYRQYSAVKPPVITKEVKVAIDMSKESGRAIAKVEPVGQREIKNIVNHFGKQGSEDVDDIVAQLFGARRISTRSDKEFWVTLSDGSLVHMNYDTRLIYPEKFVGDTRDVIIEGEAYFMVAKDRLHPFVVHTPHGIVKEYGTEFNVDTRHENATRVVLLEGSISVTPTQGREQMLKPGERCTISNERCFVESVDTTPYLAWNTGKFFFHEEKLGKIMDVISRWYGYKVEFEDESLRNVELTGNFDRYVDIHPTLGALEQVTGMRITIQDKKIIIQQ